MRVRPRVARRRRIRARPARRRPRPRTTGDDRRPRGRRTRPRGSGRRPGDPARTGSPGRCVGAGPRSARGSHPQRPRRCSRRPPRVSAPRIRPGRVALKADELVALGGRRAGDEDVRQDARAEPPVPPDQVQQQLPPGGVRDRGAVQIGAVQHETLELARVLGGVPHGDRAARRAGEDDDRFGADRSDDACKDLDLVGERHRWWAIAIGESGPGTVVANDGPVARQR